MYALLVLTTTASMYYYLKKHRLGHILATTAALYTHHFAIFGIFVQVFWHFSKNRKKPLGKMVKSFKDFFIIAFLYLPWFYPLYYQTSLVGSGFWLEKPTLKTVAGVMGTFILGFGQSKLEILAFIFLVLIILFKNWQKDNSKSLFLSFWFLLPVLITFAVSQFFQSIFFDRYMLFVIPGALLVLASNRQKISRLPLTLFLVTMLFINFNYFTHPKKRPFRDFATLVKDTIDNHDFLINYNAASHHLFETKYYGLKAPLYVPEGKLPFYVGTALMEESDIIKEIPPDTVRLGVITSGSLDEVEIPGFRLLASFEVENLKFARFVPYR